MFEEVKGMCEKVDVNTTLLVPVTGEKMSSLSPMVQSLLRHQEKYLTKWE